MENVLKINLETGLLPGFRYPKNQKLEENVYCSTLNVSC